MGIFKQVLLIWVMLTAVGCAFHPSYEYLGDDEAALLRQVLGDDPVPTELVTLQLSPEIKALLDQRIDRDGRSKEKLAELRALLFSEDGIGIKYDANATLTAQEVFVQKRGNCLAMTNLFIAAARYVGLDAHYQTVEVKPTWNHLGQTMIRYEHIVAVGRFGEETYVVDFLPEFLIGDRPSKNISDEQALALYYNNLGAEAVVDDKADAGIPYLQKSLQLNPENSDAWNNMGAALRRTGNEVLVEFSYLKALEKDSYNYSALSNLARFYEMEGRTREAEMIAGRVDRYRKRNPYFHAFAAEVLYQQGEYEEAQLFMDSAIRLKRDEPAFYEASAKIYLAQGNEVAHQRQLQRAQRFRDRSIERAPVRVMESRLIVRRDTTARFARD
ncbi:MAG: tetratricopeptide repeat protein [Pseudomonadales bacterium]